MTAALTVIAPGLSTTVQDRGRFGYRELGVPESGALDSINLRLANALVGNAVDTAALEMLLMGPTLEVAARSVRVAVAGGDAAIAISGEAAGRRPAGQSVRLGRGTRFRVGSLTGSTCAYLAVEGGFDLPLCLGSASTLPRARLGGLDGRALRAGDVLPLIREDAPERPELSLGRPIAPDHPHVIHVVLGPQKDYFTDAAIEMFLGGTYTISRNWDRMGMRLEGPKLEHAQGHDIVSDGIVAGAIQVPGTGQPILLLADHPTTGGYPKIATVISADLSEVARRRPGSTIRFAAIEIAEAERRRRAQEQSFRTLLAELRPLAAKTGRIEIRR